MVDQFYTLAKNFCVFIDSQSVNKDTLEELTTMLLNLYLKGLQLPFSEDFEEELEKEHIIPTSNIELRSYYNLVYDPFSDDAEDSLVGGSLEDDLQDIYGDLREGIVEYEAGNINNACWEWRFGLDNHWGVHAVNALKALHWLRTVYS